MDERNYNGYSEPQDDIYSGGDDYSRQYIKQINEISRLDGQDYSQPGDWDIDFQQYPDSSSTVPQRDYPPQRQQRPQQRPSQRQKQNGSHRRPQPKRQPPQDNAAAPKREYIHPKRAKQPAPDRQQKIAKPLKAVRQPSKVNEKAHTKSSDNAPRKGGQPPMDGEVKKKKFSIKKLIIIIVSVLTALFLIFNLILLYLVGKVTIVKTQTRDETIKPTMESEDVKNILIIGSDTRDPDAAGRTDSMIVLSINSKKKEITMTSLMRDIYVPIVGYDKDGTKMYNDEEPDGLYRNKLNAAYVFGGAELLMDTIQYNFGLKIDEYFYIDFNAFINIIDSIDGIDLEITDEEAEEMNHSIREHNILMGKDIDEENLTKGGTLHLSGNQALSYARLRNIGNADFQRTQRQRIVLNKVVEKVKSVGPFKKFSFLKTFMANLTTNMSRSDLFFYGYKVPFMLGYTIKELRIPGDNDFEYGTHSGQSTLDIDLEKCREEMRKAIFS